jgi:hypothetical protein
MPAVVPLVRIVSFTEAAPTNFWALTRAAS